MSILVDIKQNPKNLKKNGLKFIKKIAATENLCFGVLNEACSFDEYEGGEDIRNQLLILFSRKSYGRGMSLTIDDNYNLELVLNYPATQTDIETFYKFIDDFCVNFKFKTFLQEGNEYSLDKINKLKEEATAFNKKCIKTFLKSGLTIFGCIYPITLEQDLIDTIDKIDEEKACRYFESYLDKKQKIDLYFAKPIIYEYKKDEYFARYALTENVPSIFP